MRINYRNQSTKDYWTKRWSEIEIDYPMKNSKVYPLVHALKIVKSKNENILEAGCGAGRLIRYFHEKNYKIYGFDYIDDAIHKLKKIDPQLKVKSADITNLDYQDSYFSKVLAFGIYHGLENGIDKAISETNRVMKKDALLCASFRADNIQNYLNDLIFSLKERKIKSKERHFHKINLKKKEILKIFKSNNFEIIKIENVTNMPILYKFKFFRSQKQKIFNETLARAEGYHLSLIGRCLTNFFSYLFPNSFCNLYVVYAKKT